MSGEYSYWCKALALTDGRRPLSRSEMYALGVSETPQHGFYRKRAIARGPYVDAVAIWWDAFSTDAGEVVATVNHGPSDLDDTWLMCAKYPVHESQYHTRMETGAWNDENNDA